MGGSLCYQDRTCETESRNWRQRRLCVQKKSWNFILQEQREALHTRLTRSDLCFRKITAEAAMWGYPHLTGRPVTRGCRCSLNTYWMETKWERNSLLLISVLNFHIRKNTDPDLPGKKLEMKDAKLANDNQQNLIKDKPYQTLCVVFHNTGRCLQSHVKRPTVAFWGGLGSL